MTTENENVVDVSEQGWRTLREAMSLGLQKEKTDTNTYSIQGSFEAQLKLTHPFLVNVRKYYW